MIAVSLEWVKLANGWQRHAGVLQSYAMLVPLAEGSHIHNYAFLRIPSLDHYMQVPILPPVSFVLQSLKGAEVLE